MLYKILKPIFYFIYRLFCTHKLIEEYYICKPKYIFRASHGSKRSGLVLRYDVYIKVICECGKRLDYYKIKSNLKYNQLKTHNYI